MDLALMEAVAGEPQAAGARAPARETELTQVLQIPLLSILKAAEEDIQEAHLAEDLETLTQEKEQHQHGQDHQVELAVQVL